MSMNIKNEEMQKQSKEAFEFVKIGVGVWLFIRLILLIITHFFFFRAYTPQFFIGLGFEAVLIAIIAFAIYNIILNKVKNYVIAIILGVILFITPRIATSRIFMPEAYRELAGDIETVEFTKDMQPVDLSKLPIINPDLAENLADKKLGELTSLGSQMEVGTLTLQYVNGDLYYVAPLEFTGFFKWNSNDGISPGYIMVNACKENDVQMITQVNGKDLKLKYLEESYFGDYINRKAFKFVKNEKLTDITFELDDSGNPYWVITRYVSNLLRDGQALEVTGTLIIDAQTGEGELYSVEDTPSWVDIIQPLAIKDEHLNDYGKLVNGFVNTLFSKKNMTKTTDGYKLIYDGEDCYYYTGITSVGTDESLIGFYLSNTKTGVTKMYKTSGAVESSAQASAQGKVQDLNYVATFPTIVNLQGQPTYFMTLLDQKGLIKGYSFVNVENYNIVSYAETLQSSYNSYVNLLSTNMDNTLQNNSETVDVEGVISRIGLIKGTDNFKYSIMLEGSNQVYLVSDSNMEVTLSKVGEKVKIKYIDNDSKIISASSFDNLVLDIE